MSTVFNLVAGMLCLVLMGLNVHAATCIRSAGAPRVAVLVREAAAVVILVVAALIFWNASSGIPTVLPGMAAAVSITASYLAPLSRWPRPAPAPVDQP